MRFAAALAATTATAVLFGLSFAPHDTRALAWLCLAPFFVALRSVGLGTALFLGWYCAVLSAFCIADALPGSIANYYLQPGILGWVYAIGIWSSMAAPYHMLFALLYRALARRRPGAALPLLAAAAWVTGELGRGRLFTGTPFFIGNPWGLLGYTQVGWDPFVQIASVTGVYGMSFALVAVNAALAELWWAWRGAARELRPALRACALALAPALLVLAYGGWTLRAAGTPAGEETGAEVAIVQANLDVGSRWRSDLYGRNLEAYYRLTRAAFDAGAPRVVFWPEAAMTFFLAEEPLYQRSIGQLLSGEGAELVAGGPAQVTTTPPAQEPRYYNSVFLLSPRGEIVERYDKEYLVPFSEYFPLSQLDRLRRRFGRIRVFEHGTRTAPLPTTLGPAGILICNEAMLPEVAAKRVRAGATYLVSPSNDGWIADAGFADKMFDIVSLRAVEQRRTLVRASTSGPSTIIDPWGRTQLRTEPFSRDWVLGRVTTRSDLSLCAHLGDAFAFGCVAAVLVMLLARGTRPGAGRKPTRASADPA